MSTGLPHLPVGWLGLGLFLLGIVLLAAGSLLLALHLWRRIRLRLNYSPVTRRRALLGVLAGLACLVAGAACLGLDGTLRDWSPARRGGPVGLVWVEEGRIRWTSATDDTELDLGPPPGRRYALAGDVLEFPSVLSVLGLGPHHRIRRVLPVPFAPGAQEPAEPGLLFRSLASDRIPGDARTRVSPSIVAQPGKMAVHLLPEGGYGVTAYPAGGVP